MRRIALASVFICVAGVALADVPPLEVTFARVSEELPTLERDGELFAIELDGPTPTCKRWTVDAAHGQLTGGRLTLDYHVEHGELKVDGLRLSLPDGDITSTCSQHQDVHETRDWLETQGAHLFRTAERCQAAIANKERVAFSPPCDLSPDPVFAPDEKSRARFERILANGGTMYAVMWNEDREVCRQVRFDRSPRERGADPTLLQGGVSYRVTSGARKGTETYGWELRRGATQMTILGPSWQWDDGSGEAMGCGDFVDVGYGKDYVESFAKLYFSKSGCWSELHAHQVAEHWYPDLETLDALGEAPLAGGC